MKTHFQNGRFLKSLAKINPETFCLFLRIDFLRIDWCLKFHDLSTYISKHIYVVVKAILKSI